MLKGIRTFCFSIRRINYSRFAALTGTILCLILPLNPAKGTLEIAGAGASFPRDVYRVWMTTYEETRRKFEDVSLKYDGKGSGIGLGRIKGDLEPPVQFAGSDSLLTEDDYTNHPDLQMFPTMAGAIVLAYNLPDRPKITLTRDQIVGIFNGSIAYWNHSSIQITNPDVQLPGENIKVIVRADSSGTTEILTNALSAFSREWRAYPGVFSRGLRDDDTPWFWDPDAVSLFGRGVYDVMYLLSVYPYSLGYLSLADAKHDDALYADIVNLNGDIVNADAASVQSTMESFSGDLTNRLTEALVDSPAPNAYPIVGYTYLVVRMTNNSNCSKTKELLRFIMWFLSSPSAGRTCDHLGFARVSPSVVTKIDEVVIRKMSCQGRNVHQLVRIDMEAEENEERYELLELPLKIAIPCVVTLFVLSICVIVYIRIKSNKTIASNIWSINIEDVVFFEPSLSSFSKSRSRSQKSGLSTDSQKEGFNTDSASMSDILHWPAKWNNYTVSVKIQEPIPVQQLSTTNKQLLANTIGKVLHENVVRFFGLTTVCDERYIITEYCCKGVLQDILHDNKLNLNNGLKFSISVDIISGLEFLHAIGLVHGRLNTGSCLLDSRWIVKISDWEIGIVKSCHSDTIHDTPNVPNHTYSVTDEDHNLAIKHFWTAPEIIKSHFTEAATKASDVYSFAICLQEIFTREEPFGEQAESISPKEVLMLILTNNLRPLPTDDIPLKVRQIMEIAWADNVESRPTTTQIKGMLKNANPGKKSVMDNMLETLEEYAVHLEKTIEEKAAELDLVKKNSSSSFSHILPSWLLTKLSNNEMLRSKDLYKSCIACVCLSGFTAIAETAGSDVAIDMLSDVFTEIIQCVNEENLIFIPHVRTPLLISTYADHMSTINWVISTVEFLLNLMSKTELVNAKHKRSCSAGIKLRLSLHIGAVTLAYMKPLSQLAAFGPGIESVKILTDHSLDDRLLVSSDIYEVLLSSERYHFEQAKKVRLKDRTPMMTYWLREELALDHQVDELSNMASVEC